MTTTATGTIVDQLIATCITPCERCRGTGVDPDWGAPQGRDLGLGLEPRRVRLHSRCDQCDGKRGQINEEGRKLAAFLGVQVHYMNVTPG